MKQPADRQLTTAPTDAADVTDRESGRVKVMFFPGCLVLSIVLSVVGTIVLNVLIRLLH